MVPFGFQHVLAALTLAGLLVYWAVAPFPHDIITEIATFAILALALDLAAGHTGLVSLGHGALFGTGAYLFAAFTVLWGWPVPLAMAAAVVVTAAIGLVVGSVVTRSHGIFFIMVTLAFGQMGYEVFFQSRTLGGDDGFGGIPHLDLSAIGLILFNPAHVALFALGCLVVCYLIVWRLLVSPLGAAMAGIHDNPNRMRAMGLPVRAYQTAVLGISAGLAAFAGTITAQHTTFISPTLLHWTTSGEVLVMIILGGLGTLVGPVLGAALLVLLRHELSGLTPYWHFWVGLFLIVVVMTGRNGAVGWLHWAWQWGMARVRRAAGAGDAAG